MNADNRKAEHSNGRPRGADAYTRLAIVGAGQLGMFLCQAARELGISTVIVSPEEDAPAVPLADASIISRFDAEGLAERIAAEADVVTFELEDVPVTLLVDLGRLQQSGDLEVRPGSATLALLKNKATQKQWLLDHGFPTLPFQVVDDPADIRGVVTEQFTAPFVQKAQTGGYDGYGVQIVRTEADLDAVWEVPSIIEKYLHRPTELAVVVARSVAGDLRAYPPVRMTFDEERNVLDAVVQPTGYGEALDGRAQKLACDVVEALDGVGVFAVELFHTDDHDLFVNEISPRVHNSGHVTLQTAPVSQFEQHVRAVCGLSLGDPGKTARAAVMRNLLYTDELKFMLERARGPELIHRGDTFIYWYGKREGRLGRKMGHMTTLSDDPIQAGERMQAVLNSLRDAANGAAA